MIIQMFAIDRIFRSMNTLLLSTSKCCGSCNIGVGRVCGRRKEGKNYNNKTVLIDFSHIMYFLISPNILETKFDLGFNSNKSIKKSIKVDYWVEIGHVL